MSAPPVVTDTGGRAPVLQAQELVVEYGATRGRTVQAVSGVSFELGRGETLGLVGESGCGKSTTGRALVQLPRPTSGRVWFEDTDLTTLGQKELRAVRRRLQLIFQDPISSLNPRRNGRDIVAEALRVVGDRGARQKAMEVLERVGVDERMAMRRPHELSGGQCQRISIARALVQDPEVLICDEPVSALDVSVQAQVLNLLADMKDAYDLSMVFISHDLAVVKNVSDRVAVMYLGKLCEVAGSEALYRSPRHHYSALLLAAVPDPTRRRVVRARTSDDVPSPLAPPDGCRFHTRCPAATEVCRVEQPALVQVAPGHHVACHHPVSPPDEPVGRAQRTGGIPCPT